jgi:hypothetical protein
MTDNADATQMTDDLTHAPPTLGDHKLSNAELDDIRACLETMDSFDAVTPQMRALIESRWPDLAAKLRPEQQ